MCWEPISEADILDEINNSYRRMSLEQRRLWDFIKITPEKWTQEPYGNEGTGFWVVSIIGNSVIWYNDIEDGFNRSSYSEYGKINDYWCNQDNLEWTIQHIINQIHDGYDSAGYASPPRPIIESGGKQAMG